MNALMAVQAVIVMVLWLYVGRPMLSRWMDDPTAMHLERAQDGSLCQTAAHKHRQIAATLTYWMVAASCFWLAVALVLPKQPEAAAESQQPQDDAADTRERWATRISTKDSARHDPLAVLVVDPFSDTYGACADAKPDQRSPKRRVVAYRHDANQHGTSDDGQRSVPLVCAQRFLCVHEYSSGLPGWNDFYTGVRP